MAHHFVTNIKDQVMVINFKSREKMNHILDALSNEYEGIHIIYLYIVSFFYYQYQISHIYFNILIPI
jgi:hypothetical protein